MGGLALEDLPGHFVDHAAMGLVSGSNPFAVTLEQAIAAGATATSVPTFGSGIVVRGTTDITGGSAAATFNFNSLLDSGIVQFGYSYKHSGTGTVGHTQWTNESNTQILFFNAGGELYIGSGAGSPYIYLNKASVGPTGTWNFGSATLDGAWDFSSVEVTELGIPGVWVGPTASPPTSGRERIWIQTDGNPFNTNYGALLIDWQGTGTFEYSGIKQDET